MKFPLTILFSICFLGLLGQDAKFTATVNKNRVVQSETFQITFSVNGNGAKFKAPSLKDFFVHSGPNQSSSMQIINGSVSQTISYSYLMILIQQESAKLEMSLMISEICLVSNYTTSIVLFFPQDQIVTSSG